MVRPLPAVLRSTITAASASATRIRTALNSVAAELESYHGRPFRVHVNEDLWVIMVIVDQFPDEDG
jgi:hypothetical protein